SADLDDRLVQLRLDLIAEGGGARRQQLRDVRTELPRLGVDNLKLLLDADGEAVLHDPCPDDIPRSSPIDAAAVDRRTGSWSVRQDGRERYHFTGVGAGSLATATLRDSCHERRPVHVRPLPRGRRAL